MKQPCQPQRILMRIWFLACSQQLLLPAFCLLCLLPPCDTGHKKSRNNASRSPCPAFETVRNLFTPWSVFLPGQDVEVCDHPGYVPEGFLSLWHHCVFGMDSAWGIRCPGYCFWDLNEFIRPLEPRSPPSGSVDRSHHQRVFIFVLVDLGSIYRNACQGQTFCACKLLSFLTL